MRRLAALLMLGLGLLAWSSCGGEPATDTRVLGRTYERPPVEGVVRRQGAPVVGARVLLGSGARETVTDAAGSYRFEGVVPGSYRLVVVDSGDDSPQCQADGTCITAESARHAAVDVVVEDRPVVADVEL